jgi:hypothetical protein
MRVPPAEGDPRRVRGPRQLIWPSSRSFPARAACKFSALPGAAQRPTSSLVFPPLLEAVGSTVTFGIFALINLGSTIFAIKLAPDTRGRTPDELEDDFRTHDAAHFVHASPANVHGS